MIASTPFHTFVTIYCWNSPENAIRAFINPDGTLLLLSLRFIPFPVRSASHKYYYSAFFSFFILGSAWCTSQESAVFLHIV